MRRREVLAALGAAAWPLAVRAQEAGKVYRVGLLWDSPAMFPSAIEAFRRGLRERAWIEGQNILIEPRWSEGRGSIGFKSSPRSSSGSRSTRSSRRAPSTRARPGRRPRPSRSSS